MRNFVTRLRSLIGRTKRPKRDPFLVLVDAYRERAKGWGKREIGGAKGRVGVLITPWLSTAVPFFSLECVEMLRRAGRAPVVLFDATDVVQNSPDLSHADIVERLVSECFAKTEVRKINRAESEANEQDNELAEPIFRENAIWRSRGEGRVDGFMEVNAEYRDRIVGHLACVRRHLSSANLDRLLIPGGIFGLSGIYVAIARELQIPFSTYDAGHGTLRLCQNGIAAHLADVPKVFDQLRRALSPAQRTMLTSVARAELNDRLNARDFRQFQVSAATGRDDLRYDLFVPLNIRWDSAALGRQRAFPTVAEWLRALLSWVESQPDIKICLRQHPRERLAFAKGSDDLSSLLSAFSSLGDRVRFVSADEPLNSYDLLKHARVVLPHTSTVGIEAAFMGVPVVLGASVYYESLGFCQKVGTPAEYFARIQESLSGRANPTDSQREDAALAYYITQKCTMMQTKFTPQPDDYRSWVNTPHEELWAQPEAADFRAALLSGDPLSLVRHERFCREQGAATGGTASSAA